jgi:hypothetical protein
MVVYSLWITIISRPGLAILPFYLLFYKDISDGYFGPIRIASSKVVFARRVFHVVGVGVICLMMIAMISNHAYAEGNSGLFWGIYERLWVPLRYFDPFNDFDFLLRGGRFRLGGAFSSGSIYLVVVITCLATSYCVVSFRRKTQQWTKRAGYFFLVVSCIIGVWYFEWHSSQTRNRRFAGKAAAYLQVQKWAEANTCRNALFLVDPSHNYGWRDFSKRSSFGSLREWGYSGFCYYPNLAGYLEGKKRMGEFGIDIDIISEQDIKNNVQTLIYGQQLGEVIREAFYGMNMGDFRRLSAKYNIDYVVLNKKYHKKSFPNAKIAFENRYYIVYKI